MDMVATLQNKVEQAYMPVVSEELQMHVQSCTFLVKLNAVGVHALPTSC